MLTTTQLSELQRVDIRAIDPCTLVDAETVAVDANLPLPERALRYAEQIRNPYAFRVGKVAVKLEFAKCNRTLDDAMTAYLRSIMK